MHSCSSELVAIFSNPKMSKHPMNLVSLAPGVTV
jgi:hypothetical protein